MTGMTRFEQLAGDYDERPSLRPSFNDFRRSSTPPLGISIPDRVKTFYERLCEAESQQRREPPSTAYIFGGAFLSYMRGEQPNDIDMRICAPQIIEHYDFYLRDKDSYNPIEDVFPYGHFIYPNSETPTMPKSVPHIGTAFQVKGVEDISSETDARRMVIDLTVYSRPVDPAAFHAEFCSAPILSCCYDLVKQQYIYHRDFERDAAEWAFRPFNPNGLNARSYRHKAEQKGMRVVM